MNILIIDGSIGGSLGGSARGNTRTLLERWTRSLSAQATIEVLHLADHPQPFAIPELTHKLAQAHGLIFATGTYWDSWGSPLQRFFESATPLEGDPCWFGKPAAAVVTMHSVGGKGVLSRLQGVLNTFGLWIPPMCGMVHALSTQLAAKTDSEFREDFWQLNDLDVISHNLLEAMGTSQGRAPRWKRWNVDRDDATRLWLD